MINFINITACYVACFFLLGQPLEAQSSRSFDFLYKLDMSVTLSCGLFEKQGGPFRSEREGIQAARLLYANASRVLESELGLSLGIVFVETELREDGTCKADALSGKSPREILDSFSQKKSTAHLQHYITEQKADHISGAAHVGAGLCKAPISAVLTLPGLTDNGFNPENASSQAIRTILHELGHNLGARHVHDHGAVMASFRNASSTFSEKSFQAIEETLLESASCLQKVETTEALEILKVGTVLSNTTVNRRCGATLRLRRPEEVSGAIYTSVTPLPEGAWYQATPEDTETLGLLHLPAEQTRKPTETIHLSLYALGEAGVAGATTFPVELLSRRGRRCKGQVESPLKLSFEKLGNSKKESLLSVKSAGVSKQCVFELYAAKTRSRAEQHHAQDFLGMISSEARYVTPKARGKLFVSAAQVCPLELGWTTALRAPALKVPQSRKGLKRGAWLETVRTRYEQFMDSL